MDTRAVTDAPTTPADMHGLHDAVPATYDRVAALWDAQRPRSYFEKGWIDRAVEGLGPGAAVLDLGCGAGAPIAADLVARGLAVTGLDVAPAMLAIARARLSQASWIGGDMRDAALPGRFAAIIGWDSFFHLDPDEQRALIPRLCRHLVPGGRLLLNIGPAAGEVVGQVGGAPVHHASLDPAEYRRILRDAGCVRVRLVVEDPDCDRHSVLMARAGR